MNANQIKQARYLLGFNQTQMAEEIGWTSKRNIIKLEQGGKIMLQTELAIECLLRRKRLLPKFEVLCGVYKE